MLGLPKGTPSSAILLELSRLKIKKQIQINTIRFWLRLVALPQTRLARKCVDKQMKLANENKKCWGLQVKIALDNLGLSYLWRTATETHINRKRMMVCIKQKVADSNRAELFEDIKSKSSLKRYEKFKSLMPPGQDYDDLTPHSRRSLAIVRLNLKRSLPIEKQDGNLVCKVCKKKSLDSKMNCGNIFLYQAVKQFLKTESMTIGE